MSAHTPGPWVLEGTHTFNVWGGDGATEFVAAIARTRGRNPDTEVDNAALIAAAPDMLAALRSYAYQCEAVASLPTCGERMFLEGIASAMRKIIAKAEGK